jgi:hypothetical protein
LRRGRGNFFFYAEHTHRCRNGPLTESKFCTDGSRAVNFHAQLHDGPLQAKDCAGKTEAKPAPMMAIFFLIHVQEMATTRANGMRRYRISRQV